MIYTSYKNTELATSFFHPRAACIHPRAHSLGQIFIIFLTALYTSSVAQYDVPVCWQKKSLRVNRNSDPQQQNDGKNCNRKSQAAYFLAAAQREINAVS